jgi:hypothetical protein
MATMNAAALAALEFDAGGGGGGGGGGVGGGGGGGGNDTANNNSHKGVGDRSNVLNGGGVTSTNAATANVSATANVNDNNNTVVDADVDAAPLSAQAMNDRIVMAEATRAYVGATPQQMSFQVGSTTFVRSFASFNHYLPCLVLPCLALPFAFATPKSL